MDKSVDNEDPIRKRDRLAVEFANKEIAKGYIPTEVHGYAKPFIALGYMEGHDAGRESRSAEVEEAKSNTITVVQRLIWDQAKESANLEAKLAEQAAEIARFRNALEAVSRDPLGMDIKVSEVCDKALRPWMYEEALAPQAKEEKANAGYECSDCGEPLDRYDGPRKPDGELLCGDCWDEYVFEQADNYDKEKP